MGKLTINSGKNALPNIKNTLYMRRFRLLRYVTIASILLNIGLIVKLLLELNK